MLPSYVICRHARQHVKVVLSGNGGDEVFAGYPRHWDAPPCRSAADRVRAWAPRWARRLAVSALGRRGRESGRRLLADNNTIGLSYWAEQAPDRLAASITPWAAPFSVVAWIERVFAEVPGADWVNRRLYYDSTSYMPDQILNMVDRASMAVSLELRVPLLDKRLVELMAGVRGARKIEGGGKAILKRIMRGRLPDEIFTRRKLGFGLPVVRWIESPVMADLLHSLPRGVLAGEGYVEGPALEEALRDRELLKARWPFFWNLIMLELWMAQYVKGQRRPAG